MAIGREIRTMITLDHDVLDIRCPDIHPDAHAQLEFQRTLRIPDDEKVHALPAGLGCFPLRHVEDFSERLDEVTLRRGGIMMPMHRSEAMWINFRGFSSRSSGHAYPFAIKIAAGKVNALTGGAWSPALCTEEQDYVVIPEQPWIDGFAISKGIIRQFVAERLGEGFSAEEQLTGKAEFGGLQVIAYPMKADRYLEVLRVREEERRAREAEALARERMRRIKRLRELHSAFSEFASRAHVAASASIATLAEIEDSFRAAGEVGATSDVPDPERIEAEQRVLLARWRAEVTQLVNLSYDLEEPMLMMMEAGVSERTGWMSLFGGRNPSRKMGLGSGGQMHQAICDDPYGLDAWDQSAGSRCFVHLVDAAQWAEISGDPAPTEPPSQKDYEKKGLPWFDYYAPEKGATPGSKLLAGLKSWGSMYGKGPSASVVKSGPVLHLGTAQRPSGLVSEGADEE